MFGTKGIVVALFASLALTACISPKSFVDPSQPKVSYEDLSKRPEALKLTLKVEFQRNGEPFPRADSILKDNVSRVLRASGLIIPTDGASDGEIKVTVNNIADTGSAAAKGIGTGLTLGLVGTTVMDAYEMSISITAAGKTTTKSAIKHALFTMIGNSSAPDGVEVIAPSVAFSRVVEQMLIRTLRDMQQSGELAARPESLTWQRLNQS